MNEDRSAVEIDEQAFSSAGATRLSERTDLPVTGFPKVETRQLPLMERLRLRWLGEIPRSARR